MIDNETRWWMLQVQFQERHPQQGHLFSQPLPRDELLRKCVSLIPAKVRSQRGRNIWGLAELVTISSDILVCDLTIRPPFARIAEEPVPGVLEETHEPRFFTPIVVHVPLQIIAVHRASDLSRFARSAKAYASIFCDLISEAISLLEMTQHYALEIEPIAKTGSFIDWCKSLDELKRIAIHYVGPNLPTRPGGLVESIKNTAHSFRNVLHSETVDLIANEPHLEERDIEELDRAVAERKLRMRATGNRTGIGTNWSSSERPEPETVRVSLSDDDLASPHTLSEKIGHYLSNYFG